MGRATAKPTKFPYNHNLPDLTPGATANLELVISNRLAETLVNTVTVTTQEYPTEVKKTWTRVKPYLSVTMIDQPDPVTMLNVLHYCLVVAFNHYTKAEGDIWFTTDASPYVDADVEKVAKLLKDKKIIFHAFITGDCSMKESWNTLPQ